MITRESAFSTVRGFDCGDDFLARKSRELTLGLLEHTLAPFSRKQFNPGHITCTALVLHPSDRRVLLMHHHRLRRWLLPGGHVEESDDSLAAAAAREALEETAVSMAEGGVFLVGLDVHGIPPKKSEPFHLHHDLIWRFRAASAEIQQTEEAPEVCWAAESDWDRYGLADSIRNSIRRANNPLQSA